MPVKVWKDGNRCTITEWDVHRIDENGDSFDVQHFDTEADAIAEVADAVIAGETAAVVVELHTAKRPESRFPPGKSDTYAHVKGVGDAAIVAKWKKAAGSNNDPFRFE